MDVGRIKVIYHPVLKELRFERMENEIWHKVDGERSRLCRYFASKDGFVLQDLGQQFFHDILASMDNEEHVIVDFQGTAEDYEDFGHMLAYYNNNRKPNGQNIRLGELFELPSVAELFDDVMKFSDQTMGAFLGLSNEFRQTSLTSMLADKLEGWVRQLELKRDALRNEEVNLCFVGSYSAGKSTLINALIGEPILPESISSTTAKMFKLQQVGNDEPPTVRFTLLTWGQQNEQTQLDEFIIIWNETKKEFQFFAAPTENPIRGRLRKTMIAHKHKVRHEQLRAILWEINSISPGKKSEIQYSVQGAVQVQYPFAFDAETKYTILDTPGSDSDNPAHMRELEEALGHPLSSIIIYVNHPTKLEGTANSLLLEMFKHAEEKRGGLGATIDLARSFFVINSADTVFNEKEFAVLQMGRLKLVNPELQELVAEIDFSRRRLFFTSALSASIARAAMSGFADKDQLEWLEDNSKLIKRDRYRFFRYNVMGKSEVHTQQLISEAEVAATSAEQDGNSGAAYYICSGVFSLQREIEKHAARFALAVRAQGIIKGTRELITGLSRKCTEIDYQLESDLEDLDRQISIVRTEVLKRISQRCSNTTEAIACKTGRALHLEPDMLVEYKEKLEKQLKERVGRVEFFPEHKQSRHVEKAITLLEHAVQDYEHHYNATKIELLRKMQEDLIEAIKLDINARKDLDQETKNALTAIEEIYVPVNKPLIGKSLFEQHAKDIFKIIRITKKQDLVTNTVNKFLEILGQMKDDYKEDFRYSSENQKRKVAAAFTNRIDEFAQGVIDLKEDRGKVERERQIISEYLEKIENLDQNLGKRVYGGKTCV